MDNKISLSRYYRIDEKIVSRRLAVERDGSKNSLDSPKSGIKNKNKIVTDIGRK